MQKQIKSKVSYYELSKPEQKLRKEYYQYTYLRKKNDVNGNPRHYVTVYRLVSIRALKGVALQENNMMQKNSEFIRRLKPAVFFREVINNEPKLIVANEDVGYRDPKQAVEDVINTKHKWGAKDYDYPAGKLGGSGYRENKARRLRRLGKIVLHEVQVYNMQKQKRVMEPLEKTTQLVGDVAKVAIGTGVLLGVAGAVGGGLKL